MSFLRRLTVSSSVAVALSLVLAANAFGELQPEIFMSDIENLSANTGVPVDELVRRELLRIAMEPLTEAILAEPDTFDEAFRTDEGGTWHTVINVAGDLGGAQDRLRGLIPAGAVVEFRQVAHSAREIDERMRSAQINTPRLVSVTHDVKINGVRVGLKPGATENDRAVVRAAFDGLPIEIVTQEPKDPITCTVRSNCTPWRGGIAAQEFNNGTLTGTSTYTIWAYKLVGPSETKSYQMINSGHGNLTATWKHSGTTVGQQDRNGLHPPVTTCSALFTPHDCEGVADAGRIPTNAVASNTNAKVFIYHEDDTIESRVMTAFYTQYVVGDPICKSGNGGGSDCGWIIDKNINTLIGNSAGEVVKLFYQNALDVNGGSSGSGLVGGDSGAPIYWNSKFAGIASHPDGYYSKPGKIEEALNVTICLGSGNC